MREIWEIRYSVTENTLAPGKISDEVLVCSLEVDGRGWVAEEDGRILGFAIALRSGHLWALFLRPGAQGRGIGSRLHDQALSWFAAQPLRLLWLTTGATTRARRFYSARGWQYAGTHGSDEVRLERLNAI